MVFSVYVNEGSKEICIIDLLCNLLEKRVEMEEKIFGEYSIFNKGISSGKIYFTRWHLRKKWKNRDRIKKNIEKEGKDKKIGGGW